MEILPSYCKMHNTYPNDNEPCWQCINKFGDDKLQAELEKHRWIPVSERLPEDGQFCHLYMPEFNSNCPQKGWYLPDKKVWMTLLKSHNRTRKVTHWKPIILPEKGE